MNWYPQEKKVLDIVLKQFIEKNPKKELNGIIVPHAGYKYSGKIAGKAFSLLHMKKKAIILGPSHYVGFRGVACLQRVKTPLGKVILPENNYKKLEYEHSVENQIPFLQYLGYSEILPLVIGEVGVEEAKKIAQDLAKEDAIFVISTDLSHFKEYGIASKIDKKSIKYILNLDIDNYKEINACGIYPILILMHLCKIKKWKPKLIEYKNSGDITEEKSQVVGYASFWF